MAARKRSKLPVLHCTFCGLPLENRFLHSHFSSTDGQEVFTVYSRCPKKQWFYDKHNGYWRHASYESGDMTLMFYKDGSQAT